MHQVFDLLVQSEIVLPGLPRVSAGKANIVIQLCPDMALNKQRFKWFHEWKSPDGGLAIAAAKSGDGYILRFPGLADFHICPSDSSIRVSPIDASDDSTLAHLLLDQVIPRLQSHQGRLVVHASSVELASGAMVGFLGNSGSGKSTLASSFFASGARLVSDDCLLLELQNKKVLAVSPYASLRLWEDSLDSLFPIQDDFELMAHYTSKQQMIPRTNEPGNRCAPERLTALFILEQPPTQTSDEYISIEAVSGSYAAMAIIESVFALDLSRGKEVRRNFERVGEILSSGLPVFRLSYSRSYGCLPRVREAIEKTAQGLSG